MSDYVNYIEAKKLSDEIEAVERECKDLRYSFSSRRVYEDELRIAKQRLAVLQAAAADGEA